MPAALTALLTLLAELAPLAIKWATAAKEDEAALISEANDAWSKFSATVAGLPAAEQANDAAAEQAIQDALKGKP